MSLKRLSSIAETKIASKNIAIESNILVNDSIILDVQSFSYSIDKSFGIASFTFSVVNREQLYSVGGKKEIKQGDNVKVQRSIILDDGSKETFETNWKVRQVNPSTKSTEDIIEVTCLDFLVKAGETDIDLGLIEGTKTNVHDMPGESYNLGVPLVESSPHPDTLPANFAQFFDFGYYDTCTTPYFIPVENIAPWPAPIIRFVQKTTGEKSISENFEVNYETGQLILPVPICMDDFEVWAVFSYYSSGLRVEDIIKQILLEPDGYGNTIYSSGDFETTLNQATNKSTDNLIRDIINTKKWWLAFSNILDTLTEEDFSIPVGGGSIIEINEESGCIILENEISSSSNVICTKDYTFNTLQYTGIDIPFIRLSHMEIANRFDAINKVKEYIAPNYVLMTLGDNKLWGRYLSQKAYINSDPKKGADYKLDLIGSISYNLDEDIYTHVKVFGKSNNPHNIMQEPSVAYDASYLLLAYGENMDLMPVQADQDTWPGVLSCRYGLYPPKQIIPYPKPIVTIDGIQMQCLQSVKARSEDWGRIKKTTGGEGYFIGYTFTANIAFNQEIKFYVGDVLISTLQPNELKPEVDDNGNLYYAYYPQWADVDIASRYPDFYVTSDPNLKIDYRLGGFITIKDHVGYEKNYRIDMDRYGSTITGCNVQVGGYLADDKYHTFWSGYLKSEFISPFSNWGWAYRLSWDNFGTRAIGYKDSIARFFISEWNYKEFYIQFLDANNRITYQSHMSCSGGGYPYSSPVYLCSKYQGMKFYNKVRVYSRYNDPGEVEIFGRPVHTNAKISSYYLTPSEHSQEADRYKLHDKNPLTQLQIGYKSDPGSLVLVSFDLQEEKDIDIIDFSTGFYKIGDRNYDFSNTYSIEYSLNNVDWYPISKGANNFSIEAGETENFEDLGEEFKARYLRIVLNKAEEKIIGGVSIWPVSITEFSAYENTILVGEAKLCENKEDEDSTHLYDSRGVLTKLGDILQKDNNISEQLNTQIKINKRAKDLLTEYYKGTTRVRVVCFARPDISIGDTVWIFDEINSINRNYFVESITVDNSDLANLILAFYGSG